MQKPSFLRRLRRALWYVTAGTVILVAVLLSLTRLLLPELQGYRAQVEARASAVLGQPVRITTLRSRLRAWSPMVVLEGVELLNAAGELPVARFHETEIAFDLLSSVRRLQPVIASLTVVGADLTIVRQEDGRLEVQGLAGSGEAEGAAEGIGRWLLAQGRLALRQSRLHWRDHKTGRHLDFAQVDIELNNLADRHQLNVDVMLPPGAGRDLRLALDLEGDVLQPGAWRGRGHLQGRGLQPAPWLEEFGSVAGVTLRHGVFDLQAWGTWEAGCLQRVDGRIEVHDLSVGKGRDHLALARLATAAHWGRHDDGWALEVDDLRLWRKAGDTAEPIQARVRHADTHWDVQVATLRLEDAALVVPWLDAEQREALATMRPRGRVREVRATVAADGRVGHAQGVFEQAALVPWQRLPGFSGLSGAWVWSDGQGQVVLDSRKGTLELPRLFREPLPLQQLQGVIALYRDQDGWRVTTEGMQVANADIHASVDATLALPAADSPYLDLRGTFWDGRATATPRYLPAAIMGRDALAWLDQAFKGGKVTHGNVLFHGPLRAFPFDGGEGRFEVDFAAQDADLFLQTGWPGLRQTNARVRFLNRSMVIDADSGRMYDSQIGQTRVAIADLHQPLLTVQGKARLNGDDAIRLLRETPLRQRLGEYVAALRLEGASALELEFALPLKDTLAATQPFRLAGAVMLQGNRLWVQERFPVEAIEGRLAFTESSLRADVLRVQMLDGPANITIYGEGSGDAALTVIAGRGVMNATGLRRLYDAPALEQVHGSSAWQGTLTLPHHDKTAGTQLRLYSELSGLELALPQPLRKAAEQASPLELVHYFSGTQQGQMQLGYGEVLSAQLDLDEDGRLRRGALHLGPGTAQLPVDKELYISGAVRELDLGQWRQVLQGAGKGTALPLRLEMDELHLVAAEKTAPAEQEPDRWQNTPPMDVRVQRFDYGTLQLGQLSFKLDSSPTAMQVSELMLSAPALRLSGQARWQLQPRSYSEVKLKLDSPDVGRMLSDLNVASVIGRGTASAEIAFNWPGSLTEMEAGNLGGHIHARVEDGLLNEVSPGAGRLLGLLSLQALPRRLILDFRDLFQKGLAFSSIEGDFSIRAGDAYTSNLVMDATVALIRIEGRTGLAARDYDQRITVVPNLSGTAPVIGTLAFSPQVGALMLLFQRLLKKNVDEAARTEYHVTGSWDQPQVEKIQLPGDAASVVDDTL